MSKNIPVITHSNGTKMQAFGLGTYASEGGDCERAIKDAIDAGYRHFDTAYFYGNEAECGNAIKAKIAEGVIKREDVFIVSKLWNTFHDPDKVEKACRKTLKNFGLDYIDLYLIHWPFGYKYVSDDNLYPTDENKQIIMSEVDYVDTWKEMEKLPKLGLTKSIGVSNFSVEQLKRLLSVAKIKPIHNQIECHPALIQHDLIKYCKSENIVVTAYRPLGNPDPAKKTPNYIFDDKVAAIGAKYKKSAAQIVLRYLHEVGVVPLPKSVTKDRIKQNINIFDFKLDSADLKVLESYNTGERLIPVAECKKSKFYPF